jgi:tRNA dimethylallyltransferase
VAKRFNGEIISADSMQIYQDMNIGTAKITTEEMQGIPHHLIDIKKPNNSFSVSEYQALAREKIATLLANNKTPILVGGTGLYINSTLYNYHYLTNTDDQANNSWRNKFREIALTEGKESLHIKLQQIDPVTAAKLHPNDEKRVTRALEYFMIHKEPISSNNQALTRPKLKFSTFIIGLTLPREILYKRIDQRVDAMIEAGLEQEVRLLVAKGCTDQYQAMQGIGYRQMLQYISGEKTLAEVTALIKQESRRYAKRQLTWFRRDPNIHWFQTKDLLEDDAMEHLFDELIAVEL